jgi:hypothetical protein
MSPLVSLPPASLALRAAALEELRGTLEAIRCSTWLAAREDIPERQRRLLVVIDMAAERAEQAVRRLQA